MKTYVLALKEQCYSHVVTEHTLPKDFTLLHWLKNQSHYPKYFWKGKDGKEFAGVGSILDLPHAPVFSPENTSPATFWGGRAFQSAATSNDPLWSSFPRSCFFLPKKQIHKVLNGYILVENTLGIDALRTEGEQLELVVCNKSFQSNFCVKAPHEQSLLKKVRSLPEKGGWQAHVALLLTAIQNKQLMKVVLARRTDYQAQSSICPYQLFEQLQGEGSTHFLLAFSPETTFFGATPEHLFKREGRHLTTEAVAGTRQRGHTQEEDRMLEDELKQSVKDVHEFSLVKHSIYEALTPFCTQLEVSELLQICKTPNVQHLHGRFDATLQDNVNDHTLIETLHPTAAIGGWPKKEALHYLTTHEPFDRGWYASPFGHISQKEAELCVAIRSALVKETTLHTFVGAGIVEGSEPLSEWEELNQKEVVNIL